MPRAVAVPLAVIVLLLVAVYAIGEISNLHSQKAGKVAQAEAEGRQAALDGLPPESCPYSPGLIADAEAHAAWKRSWSAGFREKAKTPSR